MSFDAHTTTDEVLSGVDCGGQVVVVTGAASGLGTETARALAAHGAEVVLAGRNPEALDAAVADVASVATAQPPRGVLFDLASLDSVRAGAAALMEGHDHIDTLINNAGVMACPLARTSEGFEMQFGTNHLGHFLLTNLVLPALLAAPSPRVVCLSSAGHQISPILWDDPNFENSEYHNWIAYGQSKTANALFAFELDSRFSARGLHAFSLHPGVIMTPLARHLTEVDLAWLAERTAAERDRAETPSTEPSGTGGGQEETLSFKTVAEGAATSVWAATAPELADHGGAYLVDCSVAPPAEDQPGSGSVAGWARDPEAASRLWDLSARLVGLPG